MKTIRKRISSRMLLGLLIFVGVMIFVGVLMRGKLNSLLRAHIENVVATQAELMADIFEGKMVIIRALQNIIYTEELDVFCNNKIDEVKFAKALEKINVNLRGNIVISIHHYEQVLKEYTVWKKKNEKSVVSDYPDLEISPPKEDVVEYNTDLYSN